MAAVQLRHVYSDRRDNCWVSTLQYFFEIPRCEALAVGSVLTIIGTPEPESDNGLFGSKKLVVSGVVVQSNQGNSVNAWVDVATQLSSQARSKAVGVLEEFLEEPAAGIVSALVFGGRWRMSSEAQSLFETIGIVHIAAASGFHLSIVLRFVSGVAGQLPRRLMAGALMLVAVVYLVLTGASPSMLRACTAVWLVLLGRHLWWRPIQPFRLFCYGIILLIALEPQLLGSIAYQLSVAATAGIFVFSRPFLQGSLLESLFTSGVTTLTEQQHSRKSPMLTYLKESLIVSCGAQLGVLPLLLYHFQVTTLLGVLATTAVSWMLPALFLSGWLTIAASLFFSAEWLAAPAWVLSSIFVRILQVPEEISSYFQLELEVSLSMVLVMYAALAVLAVWLRWWSSRQKAFHHLELQRGAYA